MNNLVIVESPAKAKTIEGFLGSEFVVKSCYGHIRELPRKGDPIDIENNFNPTYVVPQEKKKVVNELLSIAKKCKTVWLATDEDREGEAISWHLLHALKLNSNNTKRITFNEITKKAVLKADFDREMFDETLLVAENALESARASSDGIAVDMAAKSLSDFNILGEQLGFK